MKLQLSTLRTLLVSAMLLLSLALFACGTEVGGKCDVPGSDECVDGAMCTNESDDSATCLPICEEHEDCDEGESCRGVSNTSINTCQPDS
jgi:hypothetical protein